MTKHPSVDKMCLSISISRYLFPMLFDRWMFITTVLVALLWVGWTGRLL